MLIYLYGPDSYRRQAKLKDIVHQYQKKYPSAKAEHFDLKENGDFARFKEFLSSQSLFESKKLGVVHDLDAKSKETIALLKSTLEQKDITLIISVPKKLPAAFSFLLKKPIVSQECKALEGVALIGFIKKEAQTRKVSLDGNSIQALVALYGGNTWGIITELEKISLGGSVEKPFFAPAFFPLLGQLRSTSLSERLTALAILLEQEDSAAVFNVLSALVGSVQKQRMADYDVVIKSGKLEYSEALLGFVIG